MGRSVPATRILLVSLRKAEESERLARKQAEADREAALEELRRSQEELRSLAALLINAQEAERSRLSRELHDNVNQKLAMLSVELEILEQKSPESWQSFRSQLRALRGRAEEIAEDVRRTAYQLHPSILDNLGLPMALKSYCEELSRQEGVQVQYCCRNVPQEIPPNVALGLYRIAQEALSNVAKHAGVQRAAITLAGLKNTLRLTITDAGVGFDTDQVRGKPGLGLVSIRERVRLLDGTLSLKSAPGQGTRITVHVPL